MAQQAVIQTQDLTKRYGGLVAVQKLNLSIGEGEIFGFLGPNGAGKTTTILMLLGLTEPTSGKALIYGHDCTRQSMQVRRITSYLPEAIGFYDDLTARQNLMYTARLNGIADKVAGPKIDDLLKTVELTAWQDKLVETFSKGMRQRLGMADVLLKEPKVVILDEPTTGIDPDGVGKILDLIVHTSKERKITMILCSHQLYQVQKICHRVGILVKGKMVAQGQIKDLERGLTGGDVVNIEVQTANPTPELLTAIKSLPEVRDVRRNGDRIAIVSRTDNRPEIARMVVAHNLPLLQIRTPDLSLEEIYLKYFRGE